MRAECSSGAHDWAPPRPVCLAWAREGEKVFPTDKNMFFSLFVSLLL